MTAEVLSIPAGVAIGAVGAIWAGRASSMEQAHYVSELSRMRMFMQHTEPSVEEAKAQMPILVRSDAQIELMPDRSEETRIAARTVAA